MKRLILTILVLAIMVSSGFARLFVLDRTIRIEDNGTKVCYVTGSADTKAEIVEYVHRMAMFMSWNNPGRRCIYVFHNGQKIVSAAAYLNGMKQ